MQRHQEERLTAVEPKNRRPNCSTPAFADGKGNLRWAKNEANEPVRLTGIPLRRTAGASRPYHRTFSSVGAAGPRRPLPGIQETCFRLRQRMKAAPPTSKAAAAQVPGSGTGSGPAPIAVVRRGQPDRGHRSTDGTKTWQTLNQAPSAKCSFPAAQPIDLLRPSGRHAARSAFCQR